MLRNLLLAIGVFALVTGAVVGVTWIYRGPASGAGSAAQKGEPAAVLAAAHPIPAGALLREEDLTWREASPGQISASSLLRGQADAAQFAGAVTRRSFAAGEALSRSGVVLPSERGFLAAVLAPGDRAVTITVDSAQSASGLVLPGDRVDVVLVQAIDSSVADVAHKTVGETVLDGARVVAVDRKLPGAATAPNPINVAAGAESAASAPKTITLETTAADAQRLFVAAQLGKLQLSLRALSQPQPQAMAVSGPTWAVDVSPALKAFARAPHNAAPTASPAAASRKVRTQAAAAARPVTILRGAKIETQ